jgi:hypothetical protein
MQTGNEFRRGVSRPLVLATTLAAVFAASCAAAEDFGGAQETVGVEGSMLSKGNGWNYWPSSGSTYPIDICLRTCRHPSADPNEEQTQAECDDAKARVEKGLRVFARFSRVTLPATFPDCPQNNNNFGKIRVNYKPSRYAAAGRTHVVRWENGEPVEAGTSGYPGTDWELTMSTGTQDNAIIRHEFGHALAFAHEFYRSDEPAGTTCNYQGEDLTPESGGLSTITSDYDHQSIMNSTYCHRNQDLSPWDIVGLQSVYGKPFTQTFVNARFGMCMSNGTALRKCDGSAGVQMRFNRLSLLGIAGGIERSTNGTYLQDTGTRIQWNSNYSPESEASVSWVRRDAKLVGLGGLCLTRGAVNSAVKLQACSSALAGQQTWVLNNRSTVHQFRVTSTGDSTLCLGEVSGQLKTVLCSSSPHLKFDVGNGRIKFGDNCMAVDGAKPVANSNVKFVACGSGNEQQWLVRSQLENASTGRCLKAASSTGGLTGASCSTVSDENTWEHRP